MPFSTAADRFFAPPRPRLFAHRGLALDGAENTARAFGDAVAAGATHLETDAQVTADGVALAFHDDTLDRVTDATGAVTARPLVELRSVRVAGSEPLLRLDDLLGSFPELPVNIDVKRPRNVEAVVDAVTRTGAQDRVCLTAFQDRVGDAASALLERRTGARCVRSPGRARLSACLAAVRAEAPDRVLRRILAGMHCLQVPPRYRGIDVVTPRLVARMHRIGIEVHVWTIDTAEQMSALLALGADGMITNRPDVFPGPDLSPGRELA